ncbi:MAG: ABC transporter permease [Candidatus Omnitrophica bacterium]|nr:ABC transporter permease [Candidatus Omnitrophota bacterium]
MSLVSILGVAVGVACLITVLAVMNGFGNELQKRIIGSNPHIIIEKENGIEKDEYRLLYQDLQKRPHVKGVYPFIWGQGVLRFRSRAQGVVLRSLDLSNKTDKSKLGLHMKTGKIDLSPNYIILGNELAITLGVFLGDEIQVITPSSNKPIKFKVSGIFNSGMYEYDLNMAYVSLDDASNLFGMQESISGIGIDTDNINAAASVKKDLRSILKPMFYIRTWQDLNRNLFAALKLEKWAMFVILTLIVLVAALNIVSTLTVMVTQKAKDIGILKAIGSTRKIILTIFSLQGVMIGFLGVLLGGAAGMGLTLALDRYRFPILPESVYYGINYLPVKINMMDGLIVIIAAVLISFIASIYPAYQASRLNPVDALRYE